MEQYIALLRGINISGKNKVAMPLLKTAFEDEGFTMVTTYINSGNVIFSSNLIDINLLMKQCKAMIEKRFMLKVPVMIISVKELEKAFAHAPKWWNKPSDEEVIHQVIFLIPPITIEEVVKAVGNAKQEYEQIRIYENLIFWSAPRVTLSKTSWYKIASSSVNNDVTIRNANTVNKLLLLSNK